ncbi:MAG: tRNA (adenosine(37)-N6)-threonylcarbamoyltransferase complex transferase subunit TsaD [Terriglobales bacterium]
MARILGIETSCDETAAAVVEDGRRILSSVVLSQVPVHQLYGGVVPELASREHLRNIVPVTRRAAEQAGLIAAGAPLTAAGLKSVDAIAVTYGPGLAGALLVGLTYAKTLALATAKPLIGVNHLAGHLHAVRLEERRNGRPDPPMPAIALVVSGGHTQLYRLDDAGSDGHACRLLGQTRDDAAGEAYDKVAKLLGLAYPGGPLMDKLAVFGDERALPFSPIQLKGNGLDFSFSGIKTAARRQVETQHLEDAIEQRRGAMADLGRSATLEEWRAVCDQATLNLIASFQRAVVGDLVRRTLAAVEQATAEGAPAASIYLTGGVAANAALREQMRRAAERQGLGLFAPAPSLCTDNAAMIAAAALPSFERAAFADASLTATPQLPVAAIS